MSDTEETRNRRAQDVIDALGDDFRAFYRRLGVTEDAAIARAMLEAEDAGFLTLGDGGHVEVSPEADPLHPDFDGDDVVITEEEQEAVFAAGGGAKQLIELAREKYFADLLHEPG